MIPAQTAPRVLLLIPSTSYRADDFMQAAARLGLQVVVGSNHRQVLSQFNPGGTLTVDFNDADAGLQAIVDHCRQHPVSAVLGTDDDTTVLAARAAAQLKLPHNPESAVTTANNKHLFRNALQAAGLNCPAYWRFDLSADPAQCAALVDYPCVLKPLDLAASRGVIRADDRHAFVTAFHRVARIIKSGPANRNRQVLLVERFIHGAEFALEGLLRNGRIQVLALFDKPDPLDGPFFEETLYVTPSRLSSEQQTAIVEQTQAAVDAIGLRQGPVHAEIRLQQEHAYMIELAPRTIGGHCSRALRFPGGRSLEELVLNAITGHRWAEQPLDQPCGVMMIPIPRAGRFDGVSGLEQARAVTSVVQVEIALPRGELVTPLPEGSQYLGFIFARATSAAAVETALRTAHASLDFRIVASPA